MTTTPTATTEELVVAVPDYVDRFLSALAKRTGKSKEDIALFFLLKEAEHALAGRRAGNRDEEKAWRS